MYTRQRGRERGAEFPERQREARKKGRCCLFSLELFLPCTNYNKFLFVHSLLIYALLYTITMSYFTKPTKTSVENKYSIEKCLKISQRATIQGNRPTHIIIDYFRSKLTIHIVEVVNEKATQKWTYVRNMP